MAHDLGPAARELTRVAAAVGDGDLDRPTPCGDWDVRTLLGHLLALSAHFAGVARHASAARGGGPAELPEGWRGVLEDRLEDLADAWREPGAWEGEGSAGGVTMPNAQLGVVALEELVLHGWDLARAVGERFAVGDEDLRAVAAFVESVPAEGRDGSPGLYGPVVDVPEGSELDRVLALAGRDPRWAPTR